MKKNLSLIIAFSFLTLVACGPSAEEKAAAEKARVDSVNAVMAKMTEDSIMAVHAMMEQARMDSIALAITADSIAKASKKVVSKPKPKTVEQKKIEEAKKVTGGRGQN